MKAPYLRFFQDTTRCHSWIKPSAFLLTLSFILSPLSPSFAISDKAGTKAGSFLKIATDARGAALGPAMAAMAQGSEGLRWNPAALALTDSKEVSGTHIEYLQDLRIENIAAAYPFEKSAIGASLFYLTVGELQGTQRDISGNPVQTGDFTFYDAVGTVGYGAQVMSKEEDAYDLYLGAAIKYVREQIDNESFSNPAIDAGILFSPSDPWRFGATARNFSTGDADFPLNISGSAAYTYERLFTGAVSLEYSNDAPVRLGFGGEYKFEEFYNTILRAGYKTHDQFDDAETDGVKAFRGAGLAGLSFGAGFNYKPTFLSGIDLTVDYTLSPFASLGQVHTVSLKVKW